MNTDRFSTLPARLAVAVVAIPSILWIAMQGGYLFFGFVVLLSSLALYEFYGLMEKKGAAPLKGVGLLFGILVNGAFMYERLQVEIYGFLQGLGLRIAMFSQMQFLLVVLLVFLASILLIELFRERGSPSQNVGATVLGVLIIPLFFGTLIGIRELFPYGFPVYKFFPNSLPDSIQLAEINRWGGLTVVSILVTIWVCDTAAYFAGVWWGRRKLFERVSPNKTWVGFVSGLVFAVLTMVVAKVAVIEYLRTADAVVMGFIIGCFGQLGDLVESRFKRDAGVKDSSNLIPGHGGVYDRFDSLVFISPILYLYIDFVVLS
jgi:phosphatidate cytidylyltransferase